jgi:DNA polymerase elongation subunit (family B)
MMTREELEERKKYLLEEKKKIIALQEEVDRLFHEQLAKKILLNSFYGALSNIYFRFFDIRLAKSITLSGQLAVKWKSIKINEFLQQLFKNENEYIVYGDTDSVVGDTLIATEDGNIPISELYDKCCVVEKEENEKFVKSGIDIKAYAVDRTKRKVLRNIRYVMKHKVKKRFYEISDGDNEVILTADHSLIVFRDNELIEVKPAEVEYSDKLVLLNMYLTDFTVEDLGIREEYVYDVEIDDCHNFFGNYILLHNSVYVNLSNVGNNLKKKGCSTEQIVDGIDKFCRKYIEPVIQKGYKELAEYLNVDENKLESGREIISEKFLITGKKRYASLVWDNEGVRNKEPELKVTGIEIVRSSTPEAVKKYLRNILKLFLLKPENVYKYVEHVEKEFKKLPPEKIAFPRSVSNIKKYEDRSNIYKKGTPIGSRAALIYNRYIEDNDIKMEPVSDGDKIKFFYTLVPNSFYNENVFGYINNIPNREEIIKYVDYKLQFNKVFFDVVHNIGEKIGYPEEKIKEVQIDDLF